MNTNEVLKLALEALEMVDCDDNDRDFLSSSQCYQLDKAITALQEALAQPQQEPVAWANKVVGGKKWLSIHTSKGASDKWLEYRRKEQAWIEQYEQIALYTSPPAQRKPLTDKEIDSFRESNSEGRGTGWRFNFKGFVRAIEAAHGIKYRTPHSYWYCCARCGNVIWTKLKETK